MYLSEDECRRLIAGAEQQPSPFLACRDKALLTFMLFTGARRGEVLNLSWGDVDLEQRTVRFVAAKGAKTRVLLLADDAAVALTAWRDLRPACNHGFVFTTPWGARLSRRGLSTALTRALQAAGIEKPGTTPHKLRHSFACLMLRNGADLDCLRACWGTHGWVRPGSI